MSKLDNVIVALDFKTHKQTLDFCESISGTFKWVKVGMELFYSQGSTLITQLKELDFKIFLDLKMHDIPNTVEQASYALTKLGIDMFNIHLSGGKTMIQSAIRGRERAIIDFELNQRPMLIGVTVLTSLDQNDLTEELKIQHQIDDYVLELAKLASSAGIDGVVCSAKEAQSIKKNVDARLKCITPGIRFDEKDGQDQKRVVTPKQAIKFGSDFLVIGRPITQANDIDLAIKQLQQDLA
jgi:orotidine-5'-phosphate decarboxylase